MSHDTTHQERAEVLGIYANAYNENRFDDLEKALHPEFKIYGAMGADGPLDRDAYRETAERLHAAFPDLEIGPNEGVSTVFQDNASGHRARFTGTHTGSFFGIEPTENYVDIQWPWFARWKDGRIIEKWDCPDLFALLHQLGVVSNVIR